jgi:hypothetical protein
LIAKEIIMAQSEQEKLADSTTQGKCFIIMPITTPPKFVDIYKGDNDHFNHVLEHLLIPAVEEAGFEPVPPKREGSNIIHADIIKDLSDCELVLCDMSILNPNVFFEFGIRTALDKPVALVVDDKTKPIPFDTGIINYYPYDGSLTAWTIDEQKKKLAKHIQEAYKKSEGHNALWKHFGVAQIGTFKPEDAEVGEKIDFLMNKISALETQLTNQEITYWRLPQGYKNLNLVNTPNIYGLNNPLSLSSPPVVLFDASVAEKNWAGAKEFTIDLKSENEEAQKQELSPEKNQNGKSETSSE